MRILAENFFLNIHPESINYTSRSSFFGSNDKLPGRNRKEHSEYLKRRFNHVREILEKEDNKRFAVSLPVRNGTYLEFEGEPGFPLAIKSLENRKLGIKLLNVRSENTEDDQKVEKATVFVPKGKESYFLNKLSDYQSEDTKKGNPKYQNLVAIISDIKKAFLEAFWIGDRKWLPDDNPVWCEIWIRDEIKSDNAEENVRFSAKETGMTVKEEMIEFPERKVILVKATKDQCTELIASSEYIAEIRRATEANAFFIEMENKEQIEWAEELLDRLEKIDTNVAVSILDSGLNNGNLLLKNIVEDVDIHSFVNDSGNDLIGHGTKMAGVSIFGSLKEVLTSARKITLSHSLESMKILPDGRKNNQELFGAITSQSISNLYIEKPEKQRIICMALSTEGYTYLDGRPSSWSAAIDDIVAGSVDKIQKVFLIAAGNVRDPRSVYDYPHSNQTETIEDPAQSWNAITVGAYTGLDNPSDPDYELVAKKGELSPFSRTSMLFEKKWPIKPEIVLEGGNAVKSGNVGLEHENLSVLTTHHRPIDRVFTHFNATSAATAYASWMAAKIQAKYPKAWPETIRALLIHSAEWTEEMKNQFLDGMNKTAYNNLLRTCGYGVPSLNRALETVNNRVNLVIQSELQPFSRQGSNYITNEMHLHELPWPREVLQNMFDKEVTMKVTLSYYIEPGPGEKGWKDKYRYASSGLRFDLNGNSDKVSFLKRINQTVREDNENSTTSNINWLLGPNNRNGGSIHSDTWIGSAADLATSNYIAIFPVIGWWRERHHLGKWDSKIRYSLVVSLSTSETEIDLLTPIRNEIKARVSTEIETEL